MFSAPTSIFRFEARLIPMILLRDAAIRVKESALHPPTKLRSGWSTARNFGRYHFKDKAKGNRALLSEVGGSSDLRTGSLSPLYLCGHRCHQTMLRWRALAHKKIVLSDCLVCLCDQPRHASFRQRWFLPAARRHGGSAFMNESLKVGRVRTNPESDVDNRVAPMSTDTLRAKTSRCSLWTISREGWQMR